MQGWRDPENRGDRQPIGGVSGPAQEAEELLRRLDTGSRTAAVRLAILASRSDGGPILDRVAVAAAGGSEAARALLVELTLTNDLAGPAIDRVLPPGMPSDDVTQEVLVQVSRSIDGFRGDARYSTWLYALARNVALAHLRRGKPVSDPLGPDDQLAVPGRRMSSVVSERKAIREAIESLPDQYRRIVHLRDIDGLSYAEIAEAVGLEVSTVRSRLARGRAMLTTKLN